TSPYVRKVLVVAHEAGLIEQIRLLPSAADPVNRDATVVAANPLGQVPTMLTADGLAISDSRVISEYLDTLAGSGIFPAAGEPRWQALAHQSMADGMLSAALLCRYEKATRPEPYQWQGWYDGQFAKISSALSYFDSCAGGFGARADIGTI